MKRLILVFCAVVSALLAGAQTPRQELKKNLRLSASNLSVYPGPQQHKLTPAPDGKKAFYISHFGRHGSRHQTRLPDFEYVTGVLRKAEHDGTLSPLGVDVLSRVCLMQKDTERHLGELTTLGAQQHRDIIKRMYDRFPSVFEKGTLIDARSSTSVRCILSMNNALMQLMRLNPDLRFFQDASQADRHYLMPSDRTLQSRVATVETKDSYVAFCKKHSRWRHTVEQLFNDTAYVNHHVNGERLNYYLFRLASGLQNTELSQQITLYDLFDDDDIYQNWLRENAFWYLTYGASPLNGGDQPFIARELLRTIIMQADSCLLLRQNSVHLRYGHDTTLMPLVCLLGLDGYDLATDNLEQLERNGWVNYRIFPMACNVQFIFYRKDVNDQDVVFKVLLNENEATLPLKTDMAPYYHWADFRDYYLQRINAYEENHAGE
ncbi:MAG: histidine-type phosphatase [Prevotella sp.]|nr:histidine-type phosphatase [Prevotella sp.]